jgi:hypothetical protein
LDVDQDSLKKAKVIRFQLYDQTHPGTIIDDQSVEWDLPVPKPDKAPSVIATPSRIRTENAFPVTSIISKRDSWKNNRRCCRFPNCSFDVDIRAKVLRSEPPTAWLQTLRPTRRRDHNEIHDDCETPRSSRDAAQATDGRHYENE